MEKGPENDSGAPLALKLAVIAGSGEIPRAVVMACKERGVLVFMLAFHGFTDPDVVAGCDHEWFSLGEVGRAINVLKNLGVKDIVMAGGGVVRRPSLFGLKLDKKGMELLSIIGLNWLGDNNVLVKISQFLEKEGFVLRSPQEFMPSFVSSCIGAMGRVSPSEARLKDIALGREMLRHLSALDFGQGMAMQNGLVLGVEAAEGTDECISRCGALQRNGEEGAVYVKRAKVGQDEKMDLPTIGPQTLKKIVIAGFSGIAFQTSKTIIVSPLEVATIADQAGVFVWGSE
ncbi:LpxI family protein [Candidatus Hydrogenosomobacter endosymbioticus]|nr:UDP-2,3-diacylglucosamine diphosphatase LpxI [Candidatus Hydrogenosomobacter endosymbioticus]